MEALKNNKNRSSQFKEMLLLRYEPIAIRMIECEGDIPADALRPLRDFGKHIALCQAFALARRDKKTIYMDKSSEWCWNPLIGFGFVQCEEGSEEFELVSKFIGINDQDAAKEFFTKFPRLQYGKYIGIAIAPLCSCTFAPELVLIYCNNAQLRSLIWAVKHFTGDIVRTEMDAIDSCVYACVPPLKTREFRVTLPDVGEYERAGADEDEIILSVPGEHIDKLIQSLRSFCDRGLGYAQLSKAMQLEFPRPPFYNDLFRIWGLDQGEDWKR